MIIGDRLRILRDEKHLSQRDIQKRTGLFPCYISRVECGHTVPAVETIEKFARGLEVPIYQLFYDGDQPPPNNITRQASKNRKDEYGATGKQARLLDKFRKLLGQMDQRDRNVLLATAKRMASR
jgi:transcriptional regulator with XRE-family HTH domain